LSRCCQLRQLVPFVHIDLWVLLSRLIRLSLLSPLCP
jgi:hypothetical protein